MAYSNVSAPIIAALTELRSQRQKLDLERQKLDEAISALEKLLPNDVKQDFHLPDPGPHSAPQALTVHDMPRHQGQVSAGTMNAPYAGLTIPEAAKHFLRSQGRPLTNREIADGLVAGGFKHESDDFVNTIGSILRRHEMTRGELVRHENRWYLPEFLTDKQV